MASNPSIRHRTDKTAVRGTVRGGARKTQAPAASVGMHGGEMSGNVLPAGTRVAEFEITRLIGEGGFGIVYLAYDHSLDRHVALKEYMPGSLASRTQNQHVTVRSQQNVETFAAGLRSFVNEAKLLAQFDAPSLVKVYRFWEANGTAYMVMPFYDGITVKQALKERRIVPSEEWIKGLLANLFDAVETIHRVKCYHRDIAPDNILLLKNGQPVLLDFGAARRVIGDLTQGPTVILKPGYAPIEQYADIPGLKQGPWTDIYALAAVVYFLITGKSPSPAVSRVVHDDMVPAREAGRGRYSSAFLVALDRALAVRPENRIQTVAAMRRELQIDDPVSRTMPLHKQSPAMMGEDNTATDVRHSGVEATQIRPLAAPERKKTSPPLKAREWPRLSLPGKGTAIALGLGVLGGVVAGLAYWQLVVTPQQNTVAHKTSPEFSQPAAPREAKVDAAVEPARETSAPPRRSAATAATERNTPAPKPPAVANRTPPADAPLAMLPAKPPARPSDTTTDTGTATDATPPVGTASSGTAPSGTQPSSASSTATPPPVALSIPSAPTQPPPGATPRTPSEDELWRSARKSDRAKAYTEYLSKFPDGRYADVARQRLEREQAKTAAIQPEKPADKQPPTKLAAAPPEASEKGEGAGAQSEASSGAPAGGAGDSASSRRTAKAEDDLWSNALALNQAGSYQRYLEKYPDGKHVRAAKDQLAKLTPAEPAQAAETTHAATAPKSSEQAPPAKAAPKTTEQAMLDKAREKPAQSTAPPTTDSGAKPAASGTTAAAESGASGGSRTIKLEGQTLVGDFNADRATGAISGRGKITWSNGDQFEGTLARGTKEGKGQFTWANGQRYSGDWARDKPNGKGTITFANGNRYEGEVRDGVPNGNGKFWFSNGNRYEGEVKDGTPDGKGVIVFSSGDRYEGEVRAGLQHGQGTSKFKQGDVYSGGWIAGKSNGRGRYTWSSGSYWEGEFRDGRQTENGTLVRAGAASRPTASGDGSPSTQASGSESESKP